MKPRFKIFQKENEERTLDVIIYYPVNFAAYTEDQVRTAYKAGVLRGLEYKSRGKKKTVYETPSEEQLIQTLKKKL